MKKTNKRPNILMITLDSARPEWLSCLDHAHGVTPNIDRLASDAYLFENCIGPSAWTFPAMSSVFTGMLPTKHGGHDEHLVLDSHYPTIAETLSKHGYDTAAFSDVPYVGPMTRLDRGFRILSNLRGHQVSFRSRLLKGLGRLHRTMTGQYQKTFETHVVMYETADWIDQGWDRSKPFFLYVHSDETHAPFLPPARYRKSIAGMSAGEMHAINQDKQLFVAGERPMSGEELGKLRDLARAETAYVDEWIGWLLDRLTGWRLLDDTIVIIAADHGENFGEHGLLRHGLCLYDTLLRVPLVIRVPGLEQSRSVRSMVQSIDLYPTLMRLAEIDDDQVSRELQGTDLIAQTEKNQFAAKAISELYRPATGLWERKVPHFMPAFRKRFDRVLRAVRTNSHKFIWSSNGEHELYDLQRDPGETHNIARTEPTLAVQLHGELDLWLESFAHAHPQVSSTSSDAESDERVMERLRDLGYVE